MSDDDSLLQFKAPDQASERELLLYDYFKHLTSLTLLTLGAVLAIAQAADSNDVKPPVLIAVLVVISGGGICSFVGASEIVKKRYTGSVSRSLEFYRKAAPTLLALGVGMFLGVYVDTLS
jgi:hypothetical protein